MNCSSESLYAQLTARHRLTEEACFRVREEENTLKSSSHELLAFHVHASIIHTDVRAFSHDHACSKSVLMKMDEEES